MKKYFTSFVVAGTVASFATACHKKAKPKDTTTDKKDTKKTEAKEATSSTLKKGTAKQGQFKIGVVGSNYTATKKLQSAVNKYTQDLDDANKVGDLFFKLPSGLVLKSSTKFNKFYGENILPEEIAKLKKAIKEMTPLTSSSQSAYMIGGLHPFRRNSRQSLFYQWFDSIKDSLDEWTGDEVGNAFWMLYKPYYSGSKLGATPNANQYNAIFTNDVFEKIYRNLLNLQTNNPTGKQLYEAFREAGIDADGRYSLWANYDSPDGKGRHWYVPYTDGAKREGRIYFNKAKFDKKINEIEADALGITSFSTIDENFKDKTKKALSDKTQLAKRNLDALFIQVSDGAENDEKVYKAVVEKKEFKNTHLFFIGDKAKSQSGSSSKTFAGGKVSTASYDKYAATYIAGFQAAAGTLKYSESEDSFVETSVAFLIGADGESDSKKKAFAFRRGVEAAKNHPAYSKYLKVKFVSKTEDSSKASKKLFREVSEWKEKSDSKTKLYHFSSSDTFSDAERRVIYLAGTTAKDWIGETKVGDIHSNHQENNLFWEGDDTGLIGALYNAKKPSAKATSAKGDSFDSLTDKTYSRNVWVVLDKAYGETWSDGHLWTGPQNDKGAKTDDRDDRDRGKNRVLSNKHNLTQVYEGELEEQVALTLERKDVKFYGAVGKEPEGTEVYAKHALKAMFMGGVNYMVGKHTIFGAPLDVSLTKNAGTPASSDAWNKFNKNEPWSLPKEGASDGKNKARYEDSLTHAWEKELSKDALVKESAWLK